MNGRIIKRNEIFLKAEEATSFIFLLNNKKEFEFDFTEFNKLEQKNSEGYEAMSQRLLKLANLGFTFDFLKVQSETFSINLQLIDSKLPLILSQLLLLRYLKGQSNIKELLPYLVESNPLMFDQTHGHPFYEYKIKKFLTEIALGMSPKLVWNGVYDATSETNVENENGELITYNINNRNQFAYLLNHTCLEHVALNEDIKDAGLKNFGLDKRSNYGWIYKGNDELLINLGLQLRIKLK